MKTVSSKEEKYIRIYEECLKLIHEKDLRAINHSTLSRRTQISRAWIYKYLGIKRESIIKGACKYFGHLFTEISLQEKVISSLEDLQADLHHGSRNNLEFALKHPYIVPLYIRFAGTNNILGQTITEIESTYKQRLINKFEQVLHDKDRSAHLAHVVKSLRIGVALEYCILSPTYIQTEQKKEEVLATINRTLDKLLTN